MSRQKNRRLSVYDRVIKIVADPPISKKSSTIAPPPAVFSSARKCEVTISQKNIKPIFSIIFESILSQSKILF